jgi:transcription-repair coupling factor (superfamily II helicase)
VATPRPTFPRRRATLDEAGAIRAAGGAWAGLGGDSLAFVLAREAAEGRWLVVVDGEDRAADLLRALTFFHPAPDRIESFPADDNRPYDGFSPDPVLPQRRLRVLDKVDRGGDLLVVTTARALTQRVPTAEARLRGTLVLEVGMRLERDDLAGHLTDAGYFATARADAPGRFAVRGDVLDVWPTNNRTPIRVDFFDDEIERLRRLDPDTLTPDKAGKRVTVLPAAEERIDGPALERALVEIGRLLAASGQGDALARRRQIIDELRAGMRFSGLQEWLPALVPTAAPLEVFADLQKVVVYPDDVQGALRDFETNLLRRYELLEAHERPLVPPAARYVPWREVVEGLAGATEVLQTASDRAPDLGARGTEELAVRGADLAPVVEKLDALVQEDLRLALVVKDDGRGERLVELLAPHELYPIRAPGPLAIESGRLSLVTGDLPRGFVAPESGWAFVPVAALFGGTRRTGTDRAHALWDTSVTSTAQLKVGDAVVHRLHGVGRYRGLQRLEVGKATVIGEAMAGIAPTPIEQDFVRLEYRDGDLMFLPVASLNELSRYTASGTAAEPQLDKLGGATWDKRKGKVRDNLLSMANDLVRLYARRELAVRPPYPALGRRYLSFEARFPYVETPDQRVAIDAVMDDLSRPYPMDRLICGDVGFGKTEVAMRAAMRVVEGGRQVSVLCPTTVLAHQHLRSFRERFAGDPSMKIGMWSRFTSPSELVELKRGLADGSVQVVVGTSSLLGREARFRDLGLVVIDEEHRFGVKQKDRLKRMRAEVDVLALSATPIPRTLQLALTGVREMSIIATPPPDRLAVRTTMARLTEARVRDAILAEVERGGQAWFVHNRVESIQRVADQVAKWVPEVRVAVAHGQMADDALEQVLVDFVERRFDVLVCTAIVESGIDLPNVNTMLVDRADLLGLAQLHQLRGRVGRGDRRATCILLTADEEGEDGPPMTADARKRLRVIVENQSLGSGFQIASADLELRGGGNLLGASQSGNIDQVGYDTWVELLEEAVHHARGELDRDRVDPDVDVPVPAFLPDNVVKDTDERLMWYRRISNAATTTEIDRVLEELESEHGDLPEPARNLGDLVAVRLQCRELGITRCAWLKVRVVLELHEKSGLHAGQLAATMRRHPKRMTAEQTSEQGRVSVLSVRFTPQEGEKPFRYLRWVFSQLRRTDG